MSHSPLLENYLPYFKASEKPILDLACGNGRNGLFLHQQGFPVYFADQNQEVLSSLQTNASIATSQCICADFENGSYQLAPESYQAIMVFRYLHRPLMAQIRDAIMPGGFIIYETFTTENRQFGRPNRDAFLLQENELKTHFQGWHCLHYFEGIKRNPDRAIAQIVCQKPIC